MKLLRVGRCRIGIAAVFLGVMLIAAQASAQSARKIMIPKRSVQPIAKPSVSVQQRGVSFSGVDAKRAKVLQHFQVQIPKTQAFVKAQQAFPQDAGKIRDFEVLLGEIMADNALGVRKDRRTLPKFKESQAWLSADGLIVVRRILDELGQADDYKLGILNFLAAASHGNTLSQAKKIEIASIVKKVGLEPYKVGNVRQFAALLYLKRLDGSGYAQYKKDFYQVHSKGPKFKNQLALYVKAMKTAMPAAKQVKPLMRVKPAR